MRDFSVSSDLFEKCDAWVQLSRSLGHWWSFGRIVIASERMLVCNRDADGRLHSDNEAAMAYRDGTRLWCIHGVRVTEQIIRFPETLTIEQIREESNAEVRRIMIDRFTPERYLRESDAELLHKEHEPIFPGLIDAELWRVSRRDDTPLVMIKCRNTTPEPDGTHKEYWLRPDHECRPIIDPVNGIYGDPQKMTCHNALASTWGLRGEEYIPTVES